MKTAIRDSNIELLERDLQQSLESTSLEEIPCNIQCSLKAGTLLVTCEHGEAVNLKQEQIFRDLQQIILATQPESTKKVGICLKLAGHKYPYAYQSFLTTKQPQNTLSSQYSLSDLNPQDYLHNVAKNNSELSAYSTIKGINNLQTIEITPELIEELDNPFDDEYLEELLEAFDSQGQLPPYAKQVPLLTGTVSGSHSSKIDNNNRSKSTASTETITITAELLDELDNPFDLDELELITTRIQPETSLDLSDELVEDLEEEEEEEEEEENPQQKIFTPTLQLASLLLGIAVAAGSFYAMTRPCVLDKCEQLQTAKSLSQQARNALENVKNSQGPALAEQELTQASQLLENIPFWSIRYLEARHLLLTNREEIESLGQIRMALVKGAAASNMSQNPPHPVQDWMKMQSLWQEAIALLEQIPEDSKAYAFANYKLERYRKYLAGITGKLTTESEANEKLNIAKKQAQLAQTREVIAQFPETWEQAEKDWRNAVEKISKVPADTMAYQEAQNLVFKYEAKLKAAQEQKTLENKGKDAYNRALNFAKQAQDFDLQEKSEKSAQSWRNALNSAKAVPTNSSFHLKAQPLISSYSIFLTQAEAKYLEQKSLEDARRDLSKTCTGKPLVCKYSVTEDLISVQLTADYVKKLRDTAAALSKNKNDKSKEQLENHVKVLQTALEAISNNAGIPLDLYNQDGLKIGSHNPL